MPEDKKNKLKPADENVSTKVTESTEVKKVTKESAPRRDFRGGQRGRGHSRGRDGRAKDEFEQRLLEVARVTRVMAGGKRMNFRACVAVGDRKGSVGVGLGKGSDVTIAVNKAVNKAKKAMVKVPTINDTIPHVVHYKLGASKLVLKPAQKGRGVIAGSVTRVILELAGIKNVSSKNLGSKSKINNARCAIAALKSLRRKDKPGAVKKNSVSSGQLSKETVVKDQSVKVKKAELKK